MKRLSRDSRGFTITEMMIVLAIAGMILLIIFEAIPALQRSSRNNQRRQDVQTMLAAVSHYELNDSGNFPLSCGSGAVGPINFSNAGATAHCDSTVGGTSPNDAFLKDIASKLTYYEMSGIGAYPQSTTGPNQRQDITTGITDPDKVVILNYEKCGSDGTAVIQGAGYGDVVALYAIETGNNGHQSQCQQL